MNEQILDLLTAADPARGVPVVPGDVEALLRRASHDVTGYDLRPRRAAAVSWSRRLPRSPSSR